MGVLVACFLTPTVDLTTSSNPVGSQRRMWWPHEEEEMYVNIAKTPQERAPEAYYFRGFNSLVIPIYNHGFS